MTYPGVSNLISVNTLFTATRFHGAARRVGQDHSEGQLRTLLRQAGDEHVQQRLARQYAVATPSGGTRRLASTTSAEPGQQPDQLRRRSRVAEPVHRSGVLRRRAPDHGQHGHRLRVHLQEGRRLHPDAGCARDVRRHGRVNALLPNGTTTPITAYNRTSPSAQSLFQVVNRTDFNQDFKSFIFQINRRLSGNWQALASYTYQNSQAYGSGTISGNTQQDFSSLSSTGGFGRTPNDLVNAYGPTATNSPNSVKLSTTYKAPLDFNFGLRYSYEQGRPYGPLYIVRGFSQGSVTVLSEPRGAFTLPATNDFQIRVDKDFQLPQVAAHPALDGHLQRVQLRHGADAAEQRLAGDGREPVRRRR